MVFDWLPVVLGLTSACLFAIGAHFQHIGLVDVHARAGTAISISSAALFYWMLSPFLLDPSYFFKSAVFIFVLVGVFSFAGLWAAGIVDAIFLDGVVTAHAGNGGEQKKKQGGGASVGWPQPLSPLAWRRLERHSFRCCAMAITSFHRLFSSVIPIVYSIPLQPTVLKCLLSMQLRSMR